MSSSPTTSDPVTMETEKLVEEYYQGLFRFALSLAKIEADAVDLTQQTFYRWATRGHHYGCGVGCDALSDRR